MNTANVRIMCGQLDEARESLRKLKNEASGLHLNASQTFVNITVSSDRGSRRLSVTQMDERTYMNVQTRGMEMVLLGIKKWYSAEIDRAAHLVTVLESRIAEATGAA